MNTMTNTEAKVMVIGRAKLREDENDATCDCCGRAIRNIVELSNGKTVGRRCALTILGFKKNEVERAPVIVSLASKVNSAAKNEWVNDGPAYTDDGRIVFVRAFPKYEKQPFGGYRLVETKLVIE